MHQVFQRHVARQLLVNAPRNGTHLRELLEENAFTLALVFPFGAFPFGALPFRTLPAAVGLARCLHASVLAFVCRIVLPAARLGPDLIGPDLPGKDLPRQGLFRGLNAGCCIYPTVPRVCTCTRGGISLGDSTTMRGRNGSSKRRRWKRAGVEHKSTGLVSPTCSPPSRRRPSSTRCRKDGCRPAPMVPEACAV